MSRKQEKTVQAGGSHSRGTYFLLLLCLLFSYTYGLLASIPYDLLSKKEKVWAHFPNAFAWYAGTSQKWMTTTLQPHSRVALKMLMKENLPRRQKIFLYVVGTEMAR